MSAFFGCARRVSRHIRLHAERAGAGGRVLRKARNYKSALERSLDAANIPTSVYMRLIDGVNRGLPTFHRYLNLRKRMMGVSELHYYDLYAPLVVVGRSHLHG